MLSRVVAFALSFALASAVSVVTDCGPSDAYIKFHNIDISPMPFNFNDNITVEVDVETFNQIGDGVRMSVNLKKRNLGDFLWETPCTNIGAIPNAGVEGYIGTCEYEGSCDFPLLQQWIKTNSCPSFFKEYNVPCKCPFPAQRIATKDKVVVDLSSFKERLPAWLIEGGYVVKVELRDTTNNDKLVGCMNMDLDVAPTIIHCPDKYKGIIC